MYCPILPFLGFYEIIPLLLCILKVTELSKVNQNFSSAFLKVNG